MAGFVYLTGAGCGPAEWITLAGLAAIRQADVILYDALIDPRLLDYAPAHAFRIPVGKRAGKHAHRQSDINALLIAYAQAGRTVVRLKGGDPFLFGRGGEEALALQRAGVSFTVIPGVSSALAVPLEAGIPVTYRGVSHSVHIITAHTRDGLLPENLDRLAGLDGTLVFLMGLGRLQELTRGLMEKGMDPDTPAAVLSGGNSSHPIRVAGTLATLAADAKTAGAQPPAVIVVGDAAGMDLRSPNGSSIGGGDGL